LYLNQQDGTFSEIAGRAGVADPRGGMGAAIGDYDGDGWLDIFSTHWQDELNVLYHNLGPSGTLRAGSSGAPVAMLQFEDVTGRTGLGRMSLGLTGWGVTFFDADHDGDLDLYWTNGYTSPSPGDPTSCVRQPDRFSRYEQTRFVDQSTSLLASVPAGAGRGLAAADLDGDGDLDLVRTSNNGPVLILENRLPAGTDRSDANWLIVKPTGRLVVGTTVSVIAGGRTQHRTITAGTSFLSGEPPEAHFGLGSVRRVDRVEVRWPDGQARTWKDIPANQRFTVEGLP
jgi:hypothetical protein